MKLTNKQDGFKFEIPPQTLFAWSDSRKALEDKVKQLEEENHELSLKYGAAVSEIDALKKKKDSFEDLYKKSLDLYMSTAKEVRSLKVSKNQLLTICDERYARACELYTEIDRLKSQLDDALNTLQWYVDSGWVAYEDDEGGRAKQAIQRIKGEETSECSEMKK